MPIGAYLRGRKFDAETRRLMGIAFEMAVVALQHIDVATDAGRDVVALRIIEGAKAGQRDPERLCEMGLQTLRSSPRVIISDPGPPRPHALSPPVLPDF
jgi:hypothetical protein